MTMMPDPSTSLLAVALEFAALGVPVIPLHYPTNGRCSCGYDCGKNAGKHPRTRHGLSDASTDREQLIRWWTACPDANVGALTGHLFDVVDCDGAAAMTLVQDWITDHGADPMIYPRVQTGRQGGGRHILIAVTGERNRTGILPGVDFRGKGGYIVAPGSRHMSGAEYVWRRPIDGDIPAIHPDFLKLLRKAPPPTLDEPVRLNPTEGTSPWGRRALEARLSQLAATSEGQRNDALNTHGFRIFQAVASGHIDEGEATAGLRIVAHRIGLLESEIEKTIRSCREAGMQKPRGPRDLKVVQLPRAENGPAASIDSPGEITPQTPEQRLWTSLYSGDAICDIPPPEPLIHGWLFRDTLSMLYGPSGAGKSFLTIDWALSVATGRPWLGHGINAAQSVLYIAAEGVSGIGLRVKAWKAHHDVHHIENVHWLTRAPLMLEPAWAAGVVTIAQTLGVKFVVFDTLARVMVGGDENTARDVGLLTDAADQVRRATGACVLLVHHTGHNTEHARGSTALVGAMDAVIALRKEEAAELELKAEKLKDHPDGHRFGLRLMSKGVSMVVERAGEPSLSDVLRESPQGMLATLDQVDQGDGVGVTVWLDACSTGSGKVSKPTFYRWVKRLLADGYIAKSVVRGHDRFRLSDRGRELVSG